MAWKPFLVTFSPNKQLIMSAFDRARWTGIFWRMICFNNTETVAQTPPDGYGQMLNPPPEEFSSWTAYMSFISEEASSEAKRKQKADEE